MRTGADSPTNVCLHKDIPLRAYFFLFQRVSILQTADFIGMFLFEKRNRKTFKCRGSGSTLSQCLASEQNSEDTPKRARHGGQWAIDNGQWIITERCGGRSALPFENIGDSFFSAHFLTAQSGDFLKVWSSFSKLAGCGTASRGLALFCPLPSHL